jgi:branched-chain amino acid transport system ATP-binding protein
MLKPLLEISNLLVSYDKVKVLHGISLSVRENEIVSIIGANGAGKSTTLRAVMGSVPMGESRIMLFGENIRHLPPHRIAKLGVGFVPEGRRLFPQMSVRENLEMGSYFAGHPEDFKESLQYILSIFPILKERLEQLARTLSGGEQQMLALGRALMSKPRLLLLDEPSLGLAPLIVASIFAVIREINHKGTSILLVEQNARMALRSSHRAYVLETGRITREGVGKDLLNDESIQQAYLGKKKERMDTFTRYES